MLCYGERVLYYRCVCMFVQHICARVIVGAGLLLCLLRSVSNHFSVSPSTLRLPQQDNPAVSHKMAASVVYNNLRELAEEQSTGGKGGCGVGGGASDEPRSQRDSQLEGVLSTHVKRLLAPLTALRQGTGKGCRTGKRRQTVLRDTARTGSGSKGIISPSSGTT